LAGSTEPVEDQPKAKQASVADDPEAFFADLTKPAEPKEETPESVVLGQLAGKTGAQMDDFDMQSLNLLSPKELEEVTNVRKDIPLTENLLRTKFDYEMSLPWNEGVNTLEDWKKIGQEVFGGGVSFLKGAKKFAEQSLFSDADQDPSGWGHPSFKPIKDYASGITALPESAAYLFTKLKEGGIGLKDRLSESLGVQDREKSYENYKARNLVDRIQTQEMQENPSIYSRILKGDMANDALAYVVLNTLPDRETLMAQEGLTAEQADSKRKEIANAIARQTTSDIASREMPADEDIATFATFTAPAGLGLGEMGLVSLGLEAGMGLTPRLIQGAKYLGKTDQEIKAMNDAAQTLQREAAMRGLEQAQKPSLLGRAAGTRIGEATPKILKELAPPAIGAVVAGDERRGEGAIAGAVLGKAGRPALAALKYAAKTPALIRDIEEARVLAAGGSKGTFETLASFPEASENTAKILRFGGRRLDNTINNVVEYAKAGVNPTLIALATGALESASPEELNKLTSTGLLYGLGGRVVHQAWGKITGVDPVIDARNRRQQDIDDLKTYRDLDPETRTTLDAVTSWDNIVDLHTQRAANAEQAYNDAVALGKKDAEQLGKVAQAERNILSAVTRANVQTRDEFSRQFVTQLTNLNQLVNGTLRAGQNNVGINILTPAQIVAKFRQDPANATATDQEILEVASQRGFYSTPEGAVEYQAGMSMDAPKKKIVFDRTKPSVVINADALKARMMIEGSTPIDALNHEVGHHVRNIPEFREANKDAEDLLFSQEVKDPAGNVVAVTAGQYSGKDLVDMYLNDYLKGKTPDQITQLSQIAGLWDYSRGALNETAVAEYMKDEIIAELNSETFSTHLGKGLDSGILHMVDVARLKTKKNLLDRAVQKFFGLGGKGEATSDLTGARFSPEVLAANRQAMRALQSLQGEVSQAVTAVESPKISRSEMLKNKAIRDRYGKYAGLFKTKMQGQVFDGNGNPIGTPIDIANPSASEGSWESRNGVTRQLNGYGARPDEVAEGSGVVIPDGGRLVVQKQIVTQPDGVTPVMMELSEAKKLQKARAQVIRQSLNTPDEGAPNRFEPVADDSDTWRGTFTPLQIQAIKDMPEGIIPKSIKEHMLKINDMIVRGDGGRMLVDYAAVMNDAGKYTAYSPKVYDVVPIGMHLSSKGNFLVTTISVGRMFDKLNAWSERMPARLAPWGGSKDAFFKEFTDTYLQNWQYREKDAKGNEMYPRGKAGETGISGTPEEALAKKDIFNDFLNLTINDFRGLNTDRTKTPRRRGDVRGKDIDRTIMSMRLDHMAELMDNDSAPKVPINYKNAISNFLPAEESAPAPAQEERRTTPFDGITATYKPSASNAGISFRPSTPTEEYPTSERGFYSGLQKTIDEKMPAKASPQQILSIVNNPQNAKAEEVKWSNIAGFLEGKANVTKQEVLDYLRNEGSVKFEERTLGGEDEFGMEAIALPNATKYSQYTLPNGENYREVVLTMPADTSRSEAKMEQLNKEYNDIMDQYTPNEWLEMSTNDPERYAIFNEQLRVADEKRRQLQIDVQTGRSGETYTSSHFQDIPNYVAHMRLNERPDAEGRDGLFIEELQSDRHQQGREKGYDVPEIHYRIFSEEFGAGGKDYLTKEEAEAAIPAFAEKNGVDPNTLIAKGEIYTSGNGVPDAPFRKDWPVQMFKRALRDAIEGDKEWIGWTNGETQAERYDLSKQVEKLRYFPPNSKMGQKFGTVLKAYGRNGDELINKVVSPEELPDVIGKEAAQRLLDPDAMRLDGHHELTGEELKVGGEGMKGFYDQILPKEIGKYVKKWGAKVEQDSTPIEEPNKKMKGFGTMWSTPDNSYRIWKEENGTIVVQKFGKNGYMDAMEDKDVPVDVWDKYDEFSETSVNQTPIWKVAITPEMRSSIKEGGQIAFMPKSEAREEERTERLPASGAELTASLVASGTSLESFGKGTLIQLAESYGIELPKDATRGEIIDAINERPQPVAAQTQETDIAFMPSSKLDETYAKAIESGDMEEAQRLVDERARQAGYTTGWYHGTDTDKWYIPSGHRGNAVIHVTKDEPTAKEFSDRAAEREDMEAGVVRKLYLKDGWYFDPRDEGDINTLINLYGDKYNEEMNGGQLFKDIRKHATFNNFEETDLANLIQDAGFDGYYDRENKDEPWGRSVAIFEPEMVKSADPATYDNEGKLIPLSQRFDTSKPDIRFMPYSPELPKTEDGKVDWEGFKTRTLEVAKPLADLSPLGGVSFMPAQDIEMKPSDDGRTIIYQHDKQTTTKPPVKPVETLSGEVVGMLEADRHNTLGDNMGGPMHPFLLSNQAIARLLDGRGFKPVWANMNSAFVTRAKNIIKNTTSGRALIQLMKEEAHISNRKFVTDVMSELDKKKASMPKDIVDSLHVILELGARNPATKLKEVTAAQKAFKDGDITQRQLNKVIKDNQEAIDKYGPMVAFLAKLGSIKSKATRGNIESFNKSYGEHIKDYQKQGWYKKIAEKYKDIKFADEAARFTFNQRGAAMKRLRGIAYAPDITKKLADSMDFKGGKNLDLVASVQLSKDPEAFAIYTGKDPKQEAKMSENERYLRDQFMKNPKFKKHPSYDWMMLGPENADSFILDKPVDPLVLFPDYAKNHPKANVRNGSKETIVGTMKKSKIPLKIK
jgi:hypothetical protein